MSDTTDFQDLLLTEQIQISQLRWDVDHISQKLQEAHNRILLLVEICSNCPGRAGNTSEINTEPYTI